MAFTSLLATLALLAVAPPDGLRVDLPDDARLFIPAAWKPIDGKVNLVIHLHGTPTVVEPALVDVGWNAVLVTFNRNGLSAAYARPFSEPALFSRLIESAMKAVETSRPGESLKPGRLIVSCFSAGFGGVREILKDPTAVDRIDGIVAADSIYCGYTGDPAEKQLDPLLMNGFRSFATKAAQGRKAMLVTHSAQIPPGYGSTTETADDLIATVGAESRPDATDWGDGWVQTRQGDKGGFRILGFAGEGPEDHMRHLRRIAEIWKRLPVDPSNAR